MAGTACMRWSTRRPRPVIKAAGIGGGRNSGMENTSTGDGDLVYIRVLYEYYGNLHGRNPRARRQKPLVVEIAHSPATQCRHAFFMSSLSPLSCVLLFHRLLLQLDRLVVDEDALALVRLWPPPPPDARRERHQLLQVDALQQHARRLRRTG